jgi:hypothetical protein
MELQLIVHKLLLYLTEIALISLNLTLKLVQALLIVMMEVMSQFILVVTMLTMESVTSLKILLLGHSLITTIL